MNAAKSVTAQFSRDMGSLSITLTGLPSGTTATLGLTGPDGLNTTYTLLTGTGVNLSDVPTGTYTVSAPPITVGGTLYTAFAPTQSAVVMCTTATIAVGYRVGGPITVAAKPADFNGDLKSDLLFNNTSTGEIAVWLMNGTNYLAGVYIGYAPTAWTINGTGDFNGDGKADIVFKNNLTGEIAIWTLNGASFTGAIYVGQVVGPWNMIGNPDLNGDGKADILFHNSSTGEIVAFYMNGPTVVSGAVIGVLPPVWRITPI